MLYLLGAGAGAVTAALAPATETQYKPYTVFSGIALWYTCLEVKSSFKSNSRESQF
jgi:hypothetical protein